MTGSPFYRRIIFFAGLLFLPFVCSGGGTLQALPPFSLLDQYDKKFDNAQFLGKPTLSLSCFASDIELCRKLGRKIYWKLQNFLWNDSQQIHFFSSITLSDSNAAVQSYIEESKSKKFESVLLDRKGNFKKLLRDGYAYLEICNKNGKEVKQENIQSISEEEIKELANLLRSLL